MLLLRDGLSTTDEYFRYRPREYDTEPGPRDPITGGAAAVLGILGDFTMGLADIPVEMLRAISLPSSLSHRASLKTASRSQSPQRASTSSINKETSASAERSSISTTGATTTPASPAPSLTSDTGLENVVEDSASVWSDTEPKTSRFRFVYRDA